MQKKKLLIVLALMLPLFLPINSQAFTVDVDNSGANATGIRNLPVTSLETQEETIYNVTFRFESADDVYGDPPDFDFRGETVLSARKAVMDALNSVPAVTTVGPQGQGEDLFRIGLIKAPSPEFVVSVTGEYGASDGWISGEAAFDLTDPSQVVMYADFVEAGGISEDELEPRYRLYNPNTFIHFYTTDANEYNILGNSGWTQEGVSSRVVNGVATIDSVDAIPYYRLYNPNTGVHFWTTDANEYNVLGNSGWTQEGEDGYIFPSQVSSTVPWYRLYNPNDGKHFWTLDANEKNVLIDAGYNDEGIDGYVFLP